MILTDPKEIAATRILLDEAQAARHTLLLGRGVARFRDQNGEEVQYSKGDLPLLTSYILELKSLLGISDFSNSGPMRAFFR